MRLVLFTPQLPYPPHQGTTIRNFNIIKYLAPRHEITLVSFGTPDELENAAPLRAMCRRIEIAPYPSRSLWQRALSTISSPLPDMGLRLESQAMRALSESVGRAEPCDVLQVEGIEMAGYVRSALRSDSTRPAPRPTLVFDDHNAEYVLQRTAFQSDIRRISRWPAAWYSWIQWRKLASYERQVCQRADHVVACSETDAAAIRALFGKRSQMPARQPPVTVIPNGVDTEYYVPSDAVCNKPLADVALAFTGKMDFRPNVDAMVWFCSEILPLIRAEIPLAHITIVGQKPSPRILGLEAQRGVKVTGWVPDTRAFVADAALYVVPLRMGSGTRLKVLEAMAMGKAIVSTARGAEGIEATPGRDLEIADSSEAFAHTAAALLRDPDRRKRLGRAARALVESKYDWRTIVPGFERLYQTHPQG